MPELPEVETMRRGIEPIVGCRIDAVHFTRCRLKPITISPDDTIGKATRLMLDHKISGLPVIGAQNQLIGIITESDIFRMLVQSWQENDESVEEPVNVFSS